MPEVIGSEGRALSDEQPDIVDWGLFEKNRTELVVMITPEILRTGSVGVTGQLPRQEEPFLPGLPQNRSIAPPPPAFPTGGQTGPVQ